jgi:hypothetical protein
MFFSAITIKENSLSDEEVFGKRTFERSESTQEDDKYENTEELLKDSDYDWEDDESKYVGIDVYL